MKSYCQIIVVLGLMLFRGIFFYSQKNSEQKPDDLSAKKSNMQQILIYEFTVLTCARVNSVVRYFICSNIDVD